MDSILPGSPASNIYVSEEPEIADCSSEEVCNQLNRSGEVNVEIRIIFDKNKHFIKTSTK
jgi:hypothetical protein